MSKKSRRYRSNFKVQWSPEFGRWVPTLVALGAVGYFVWHLMYGEGETGLTAGPHGVTLGTARKVQADATITTAVVGSAIEIVPPPYVTGPLESATSKNLGVLREEVSAGRSTWRALNRGKTWLYTIYKMADGSKQSFALEVTVV